MGLIKLFVLKAYFEQLYTDRRGTSFTSIIMHAGMSHVVDSELFFFLQAKIYATIRADFETEIDIIKNIRRAQ